MIALADFRGEISETGNGPKIIEERVGGVGLGRHDEIDSFRAEQDRAAHSASHTSCAGRPGAHSDRLTEQIYKPKCW